MFSTAPPQALALCLGVVALLLGEHRSFASSLAAQQPRMPEESSTNFPLRVGDLQELHDLKLELNARKEELKQELLIVKQQALHEVNTKKEQSIQELYDVTEGILMCLGKGKTQKTYRVFEDRVTHPEAVTACDKQGGRLALPLNDEQNDKIYELVRSRHSTRDQHYWIAADDKKVEGQWRSSITGAALEKGSLWQKRNSTPDSKLVTTGLHRALAVLVGGQRLCYTNFDNGQPDNLNKEDCGHVREWNGKWNDIDCDDTKFIYVCEFKK